MSDFHVVQLYLHQQTVVVESASSKLCQTIPNQGLRIRIMLCTHWYRKSPLIPHSVDYVENYLENY